MINHDAGSRLLRPYLEALSHAVWGADRDYRLYRHSLPRLAASHDARGRANIIHDYIWKHLVARLADLPGVGLPPEDKVHDTNKEVRLADGRLRARIKKHHRDTLGLSSYPTKSALAFLRGASDNGIQYPLFFGDDLFPDEVESNICVGYVIALDESGFERALITHRTDDTIHWIIELPAPEAGTVTPLAPASPAPSAPPQTLVGLRDAKTDAKDAGEEGS